MSRAGGQTSRITLLLAFAALLIAQGPPATQPEHSSEDLPLGRATPADPSAADSVQASTPWLWQTAAALAVVVGLILSMRIFLQRLAGAGAGDSSDRLVDVVGRANLGSRTQILFLRVHQRIIVAAQSREGLSTLAVLDQPEEVAWVLAQSGRGASGFGQVLRQFEAGPRAPSGAEDRLASARQKIRGVLAQVRAVKERERGAGR